MILRRNFSRVLFLPFSKLRFETGCCEIARFVLHCIRVFMVSHTRFSACCCEVAGGFVLVLLQVNAPFSILLFRSCALTLWKWWVFTHFTTTPSQPCLIDV